MNDNAMWPTGVETRNIPIRQARWHDEKETKPVHCLYLPVSLLGGLEVRHCLFQPLDAGLQVVFLQDHIRVERIDGLSRRGATNTQQTPPWSTQNHDPPLRLRDQQHTTRQEQPTKHNRKRDTQGGGRPWQKTKTKRTQHRRMGYPSHLDRGNLHVLAHKIGKGDGGDANAKEKGAEPLGNGGLLRRCRSGWGRGGRHGSSFPGDGLLGAGCKGTDHAHGAAPNYGTQHGCRHRPRKQQTDQGLCRQRNTHPSHGQAREQFHRRARHTRGRGE